MCKPLKLISNILVLYDNLKTPTRIQNRKVMGEKIAFREKIAFIPALVHINSTRAPVKIFF